MSEKNQKYLLVALTILLSLFWIYRLRQESYSIHASPELLSGADFRLYYSSFQQVQNGKVPGIDFFVEYPPFAPIAWLLFPLMAKAHSAVDYLRFLYYQNASIALLLFFGSSLVIAARPGRLAGKLISILSLFTGLFILRYFVVSRYDIFPATLLTAALLVYDGKQSRLTQRFQEAALLLAVAIKIYPIFLAPAVFRGYTTLSQAKKLIWTASLVLALQIPFLLFGFKNILEFLHYHSARNIEIGSTWAFIGLNLNFSGSDLHNNFGSINLDGPAYKIIAKLAMPLILVLTAAFWYGVIRKIQDLKENLGLTAIVLLSIFIVFGKVWSPQYMLWFVALLPLIRCRLWTQIAISACIVIAAWCALTALFTSSADSYIIRDPHVMRLFLTKIVFTVIGAGLCLFELMKRREHRETQPAVLSPEFA